MTTLERLGENLQRVFALEEQTKTARATVHESLLNLLQSRSELSSGGAMLSAATRAAMAKRSIAQLEACKGMLAMAEETAALVRGDATKLRDEVDAALAVRDEAMERAEAAEVSKKETCERVEAEAAVQVVTNNERIARAEQEAAAAHAHAQAAELRAERAERGFKESESERAAAAKEASEASAAKDLAEVHLAEVAAQLTREREVLAKVIAENVTFLKRLHYAEGERDRAKEEMESLRTAWRKQTEEWFASAASEMQAKLLKDWGAADGLLTELTTCKHELEEEHRAHARQLGQVGSSEAAARDEVERLTALTESQAAALADATARLERATSASEAAQHKEQELAVRAEMHALQVTELRSAEAALRERSEAEVAERLVLKAAHDETSRQLAAVEERLATSVEQERLLRAVNERVRTEASDEHGKLLETQARLEHLQEQFSQLSRQNSVLVRTAEAATVA
jgi:hypothetical protein